MERPLLSFCIPTYKRAEIVLECVQNLLQGIGDDGRYEVIVSDDCSPDRTKELLEGVQSPFFHYFRNKKNMGYPNNHISMKCANGRYCYLMSDEDDVDFGAIRKVADYLETHEGLGLLLTGCDIAPDHRDVQYRAAGYEALYHIGTLMPGYMTGAIFNRDVMNSIEDQVDHQSLYYVLYPHNCLALPMCMKADAASMKLNTRIGKRGSKSDMGAQKAKEHGMSWEPKSRFLQLCGEIDLLSTFSLSAGQRQMIASRILKNGTLTMSVSYAQLLNETDEWDIPEERLKIMSAHQKMSSRQWIRFSRERYCELKRYLEQKLIGRTMACNVIANPGTLKEFLKTKTVLFLKIHRQFR